MLNADELHGIMLQNEQKEIETETETINIIAYSSRTPMYLSSHSSQQAV